MIGDQARLLLGWDGDHRHVFESGKNSYGDPFVNLEGTGDEEAARIRDALEAADREMLLG